MLVDACRYTYSSNECSEVTFSLSFCLSVRLKRDSRHSNPVQTVYCCHILKHTQTLYYTRETADALKTSRQDTLRSSATNILAFLQKRPLLTFSVLLSFSESWFWERYTPFSLPPLNCRAPRRRNLGTSSETKTNSD